METDRFFKIGTEYEPNQTIWKQIESLGLQLHNIPIDFMKFMEGLLFSIESILSMLNNPFHTSFP